MRDCAWTRFSPVNVIVLQCLTHNYNPQIDIFCNDEMLGKDHTLKFVFVTRWRFKEPPMQLCYQPRVDV